MTIHERPRTDPPTRPTRSLRQVQPGTGVDVWCRSLGKWSGGFTAVDLDDQGWRVLRTSDGAELPVRFHETEVRPAAGPTAR